MVDNLNKIFERRIQVPWMFLDEWQRVHEDVYSNDIELQRRSYEKMLLWKARQSQLPAGVESTLELIHVHIIDQEVTQQITNGRRPMYAEHDMQLMCSAAVMRYLNHVSNVVQTAGESLFSMANKLNIPDWLVQLRHDGAHSTTLPSLGVLRMAIKFALEWLKENYWKEVAIASELVVLNAEPFNDKHVEEYLDVWQAVKMYEINNYENIDEIADKKLRHFVMQLLHKGIDPHSKENEVWNRDTRKLTYIIERVRVKLFQAINADHSTLEKLLALILESESFIPPRQFLVDGKEKELTRETILKWLCQFWKDFLIPLQEDFGLFPTLVHKLIILLNKEKCKHRQLVMALWVKQLCISMSKSWALMTKASPSNIIEMDKTNRMKSTETLKPKIKISAKDIKKFDMKNPNLKDGFLAFLNDPKGNSCPLADVKFAVLNSNKFTLLFLPSLMDVASPEIPNASRNRLKELLLIWKKTRDLSIVNTNKVIHTVEDLYKIGGKGISKRTFFGESDGATAKPLGFASEYDWATCPLGILPWQKDSRIILDMPSHISWALPVNDIKTSEKIHNTFVHEPRVKEKVNWPSVVKNISFARTQIKTKKMKTKKLKKAARLHLQ